MSASAAMSSKNWPKVVSSISIGNWRTFESRCSSFFLSSYFRVSLFHFSRKISPFRMMTLYMGLFSSGPDERRPMYKVIIRKGEIFLEKWNKETRKYEERKKEEQRLSNVLQFPIEIEETIFG